MCNYWPTKYFRCCEKKWGLKKGEEKHLFLDQCDESWESGKECTDIPISSHSVFWIFKTRCEGCKEEEAKNAALVQQISRMQFREKDEDEQSVLQKDCSGGTKEEDAEMKDAKEKTLDFQKIDNPLEQETVQ